MTARSMSVRTKLILRMGFCVAMVALMVLVGVVMANAKVYSGALYDEECGNYTEGDRLLWRFDSETGELVISGQGPMDYYTYAMPFPWKEYEGVRTVVIQDGITSIAPDAFSNMSQVEEIILSPTIKTIGVYAFADCDSLLNVAIPDGVEKIDLCAFASCDSLISVTMTDSVKEVGHLAFESCKKLEYIRLSDNIEVLNEAIVAQTNISSIVLPKNLKATRYDVFLGCTSLRSLHIPEQVTDIWNCLIWSCTGLEEITVDPNNPVYHSDGNCIIKTADKTIVAGCNTSVIPDDGSVTTIGWSAFVGMSFSNIVIPQTITCIEEGAFEYCENLTDVYYYGTDVQWRNVDVRDVSLKKVTIHKLGGYEIADGAFVNGKYVYTELNVPVQGFTRCPDGLLRFCIDGIPQYAGAIADSEGYIYYINSSTKASVQDQIYYVTKSNGLVPNGYYTMDGQGRLMDGRGDYVMVDTAMEDGLKYFADGTRIYYRNGKITQAGLIEFEGAYYYIIDNAVPVAGKTYYVFNTQGLTLPDGTLIPKGTYEFDEDGKMKLVIKNGLVDGIYYENNKPKSCAGLIFVDGSYYYIADYGMMIKGRSYAIVNTNGLTLPDGTPIPRGVYQFDEDGKMELIYENGLINGVYYENSEPVWGLINLNGDFYYIFGPNKFITDKAFHVENTNGLTFPDGTPITPGYYRFDGDGKMVVLKDGVLDGCFYRDYKLYSGLICWNGDYYYISTRNYQMVKGEMHTVRNVNDLTLPDGTPIPTGTYEFDENGKMKLVIKNGLVDGIYYENNKPVWGLINLNGDFYYIFGPNKFITDKAFHVENTNGLTFPDGTPITPGYYRFDGDGKMVVLKDGVLDGCFYRDYKLYSGLICWNGDYYYISTRTYQMVKGEMHTVRNMNDLTLPDGTPIPTGTYEFDENGKMKLIIKSGLIKGVYYENNLPKNYAGLIYQNGNYYYISDNAKPIAGKCYYITNTNGLTLPDGTPIPKGIYEFGRDGKMKLIIKSGLIKGVYYENNLPKNYAGLIYQNGNYYYISDNAKPVAGKCYYITNTNGLTFPNGEAIEPGYYQFGEDGKMILVENGLVDGLYYENYQSVRGLVYWEGDYYYLIKNQPTPITGKTYYVTDTNGLILSDGTPIPKGTYEFGRDGKMKLIIKSGLIKGVYYENNLPKNYAGLIYQNGNYYYISDNAKPIAGKTYYITRTNGLAFSDGTPIPKGTYSFDSEGRMILKNGLVDGVYYENNAPKANIGVICQDGKYYYIAANGKPVTGCRYFVTKTNGLVLKGWYHFDVNGVMIRPVV